MPQEDVPVQHLLDAYKTCACAKDVNGFVALYADDVRIFDAWGRWAYNGVAAWRKMVTQWFASLGTQRVTVTFDDVRTVGSADFAIVSAFVTYAGRSADGTPVHSMTNRLTWGLSSSGGAWRVVHEHTSAPIDFETSKAILKR